MTYFFFMLGLGRGNLKGLPCFFVLNFRVLPLFCKFLKSFFHAETFGIIDF